jgi:hypothetical protein
MDLLPKLCFLVAKNTVLNCSFACELKDGDDTQTPTARHKLILTVHSGREGLTVGIHHATNPTAMGNESYAVYFIVLSACIAGLVRAHEHSQNVLGQWEPPFQNPRSATGGHPVTIPTGYVKYHMTE